jgi:hypothetical protein
MTIRGHLSLCLKKHVLAKSRSLNTSKDSPGHVKLSQIQLRRLSEERMMDLECIHGFVTGEIFSKNGRMADHISHSIQLFYDMVQQTRWTAALALIDAAKCYKTVTAG